MTQPKVETGTRFDVWLDWIGREGRVMANYEVVVVGQGVAGSNDPVDVELTRLIQCRLDEGHLLNETESLPSATQDELRRMIGSVIKIARSGVYSGVSIYAERP